PAVALRRVLLVDGRHRPAPGSTQPSVVEAYRPDGRGLRDHLRDRASRALALPHLLDGRAGRFVHRTPAGLRALRRRLRLGLVARLGELDAELLRTGVDAVGRRLAAMAQKLGPRPRTAHGPMLHWPPLPAPSSRRVFPSGARRRGRFRPEEGRSRGTWLRTKF